MAWPEFSYRVIDHQLVGAHPVQQATFGQNAGRRRAGDDTKPQLAQHRIIEGFNVVAEIAPIDQRID